MQKYGGMVIFHFLRLITTRQKGVPYLHQFKLYHKLNQFIIKNMAYPFIICKQMNDAILLTEKSLSKHTTQYVPTSDHTKQYGTDFSVVVHKWCTTPDLLITFVHCERHNSGKFITSCHLAMVTCTVKTVTNGLHKHAKDCTEKYAIIQRWKTINGIRKI